jgi:glycosyltransferase involved in cell wall biosynthesis
MPGLIAALELQDAVRCIGWVDEGDKPALYRLATCFVFPSVYEGFGLPVLEALACGTPVVAANTSSIPEIVGDAGFLVDPYDARRLAGSMLALYNQPDLRADLSQRAAKQAEQFSWKRTILETLAVYEQVAGITG